MARGIKIKLKCCLCTKWRFHTSYHERAGGFVCGKCGEWLDKNSTYKKLPFKGWGFWPKKEEKDASSCVPETSQARG